MDEAQEENEANRRLMGCKEIAPKSEVGRKRGSRLRQRLAVLYPVLCCGDIQIVMVPAKDRVRGAEDELEVRLQGREGCTCVCSHGDVGDPLGDSSLTHSPEEK